MSKINLEGFDLTNPSKPQHVCIQMSSVFTGRASQTCEMPVLIILFVMQAPENKYHCLTKLTVKIEMLKKQQTNMKHRFRGIA